MTADGTHEDLGVVVIDRRVEWPDTDASGHYHHSTVLRWIEAAESEMWEQVGFIDLFGAIPRVRVEVNYRARVWFRDQVQITLRVRKLGRTSMTLTFEVRCGGEIAADGSVSTVHFDPATGLPAPWPDAVRVAFASGASG